MGNPRRRFDWYYIGQIYGGDLAKFCGLLRIHELYNMDQKRVTLNFLNPIYLDVTCIDFIHFVENIVKIAMNSSEDSRNAEFEAAKCQKFY